MRKAKTTTKLFFVLRNSRSRSPMEEGRRQTLASSSDVAMKSPDGSTRSLLRAESSSRLLMRSSSGRPPLRSSSREDCGEGSAGTNNNRSELPSNSHLQLKSYRPSTHNPSSTSSSTESTSFFVMVTGHIESAISTSSSLNDHLYCRYSFSYGPDWEVVHGVSMGCDNDCDNVVDMHCPLLSYYYVYVYTF